MPKPGDRETHCKNGHDLTLPGARKNVTKGRRGGGLCRQCVADYNRARLGSTKTGPPSGYKGDATVQTEALAAGKKSCSRCGEVKERDQFNRSPKHPTGLHSWCKTCCSEQRRERYRREHAEINLKSRAGRFGISIAHLEALIAEHDGRCAICSGPCPSGRRLAVDHNHATGQVRGLLCANCNRGIGLLKDSALLAQAAADYLRRWELDATSQASVRDPALPIAS